MRSLSAAFAFAVLGACGGSEAGGAGDGGPSSCTASEALETTPSKSGDYTVYVCDSAAPARGFNTFTYLVVDKSGAPVDGLTLSVQPWMPDMGHGSPGNPQVTPGADGLYQVSNVVFTMPGVWQLRTTVSAPHPGTAPASDSANPQFNID